MTSKIFFPLILAAYAHTHARNVYNYFFFLPKIFTAYFPTQHTVPKTNNFFSARRKLWRNW